MLPINLLFSHHNSKMNVLEKREQIKPKKITDKEVHLTKVGQGEQVGQGERENQAGNDQVQDRDLEDRPGWGAQEGITKFNYNIEVKVAQSKLAKITKEELDSNIAMTRGVVDKNLVNYMVEGEQ